MRKEKKISRNLKETEEIARYFLDKLVSEKDKRRTKASVIGLSGDLGAGKTAFVKAVAKVLGIKNKVNSPTFVILKKYPLSKKMGYRFMYHLDVYRLKNEKELSHIGWDEIIKNKEHLVFVEWPENVRRGIPKDSKIIKIKSGKEEQKLFSF